MPMPRSTHVPMPGCAVASSGRRDLALETDAREVFERFVDLLYRRRQVRAAFESCVASANFIDHGAGGAQARAGVMNRLAPQLGARTDDAPAGRLLHVVFDRDIGMVHLAEDRDDGPPSHRVEIYRVADGRITEHWSVGP